MIKNLKKGDRIRFYNNYGTIISKPRNHADIEWDDGKIDYSFNVSQFNVKKTNRKRIRYVYKTGAQIKKLSEKLEKKNKKRKIKL